MQVTIKFSDSESVQFRSYASANGLDDAVAAKALIMLALSGTDRTTALERRVTEVLSMIDGLHSQIGSIKKSQEPLTLEEIKEGYNLKPASQIEPKNKVEPRVEPKFDPDVDWANITEQQLEQRFPDFWKYMVSRAEVRNSKLKKPETDHSKVIEFALSKVREDGAKFYKDWKDDLKIIAIRNPDFALKWSSDSQTFQDTVSEVVDVSTDIASVEVNMEFLQLDWSSENVTAWIQIAQQIEPFEWDASKGIKGVWSLPDWVILKLRHDLDLAVGEVNARQ